MAKIRISRKMGRMIRPIDFHIMRALPKIREFISLPFVISYKIICLPFDIADSAPRGFGIPELASHLSFSAIFTVASLGALDIAMSVGRKIICQRDCRICNGWAALQCTMCKGAGKVHYQAKLKSLNSGGRATSEFVAEAIAENQAELVHIPSPLDLSTPLPSKDCPSCDGTGVMSCSECKNRLQVRISADDIMEPPWQAYNVMSKMKYPYENIAHSMKDPKIAAFWLMTFPQVVGGFNYDDDYKQKIWSAYEESMRYDRIRDVVAQRKPGWENLQNGLIKLDPIRAMDDPVIVKNVPYYKAKKTLQAEVMKLDVPPRPDNWGELALPLNASSWTKEELKDPKKLQEMTTLLNAQREMANKLLDAQWEAKWREDKLNALIEEKIQPYIRDNRGVLSRPIVIQANQESKKSTTTRRRRWWFF